MRRGRAWRASTGGFDRGKSQARWVRAEWSRVWRQNCAEGPAFGILYLPPGKQRDDADHLHQIICGKGTWRSGRPDGRVDEKPEGYEGEQADIDPVTFHHAQVPPKDALLSVPLSLSIEPSPSTPNSHGAADMALVGASPFYRKRPMMIAVRPPRLPGHRVHRCPWRCYRRPR